MVIEIGAVPVGTDEPVAVANDPEAGSIENVDTVLSLAFITYKKLPEMSTVKDLGLAPTGNGEPGTWVSVPEDGSRVYPDTLLEPWFAT